eukprot:c26979_g1_i2 orf=366-1046(+)
MYADRIGATGGGSRKRSVKDRLGGVSENGENTTRQSFSKRFRQDDEKWQHDLYEDELDNASIVKNEQKGTVDLRAKLNKSLLRAGQGGSGVASGVKDLRDKLSGVTAPVGTTAVAQRHVPAVMRDGTPSVTAGVGSKPVAAKISTTQKVPSADSKMQAGRTLQADAGTVSGFLQSLGLSKYAITFQAEEIDMSVLRHMSADDLKELGVPMGPRKKILLALASQSKR